MSYVLEAADEEFQRLERQSQHPSYNPEKELAGLQLQPHSRVLDAGCGSGLACRYLASKYKQSQFIGCDLSEDRVTRARAKAKDFNNITFQVADLQKLPFPDGHFDAVMARYVTHHLVPEVRDQAFSEFFRVLKPGGQIYIVDSDGFYLNIYPVTPFLQETLERLKEGPVDFFTGRKIPHLLQMAGFENPQWRIETTESHGENSPDSEVELMRERLENVMPFLQNYLGSKAVTERFCHEFLDALSKTETVYFVNKFIVQAVKPRKARLKLIGK